VRIRQAEFNPLASNKASRKLVTQWAKKNGVSLPGSKTWTVFATALRKHFDPESCEPMTDKATGAAYVRSVAKRLLGQVEQAARRPNGHQIGAGERAGFLLSARGRQRDALARRAAFEMRRWLNQR